MKTINKTNFIVLGMIIIFSSGVYCQDSNYEPEWILPKYDSGCKVLMKSMHQVWENADGTLALLFGKDLLWALLLNPNAFYNEFSSDTISCNRFLESIDNNVFWNPNDTTTSHLEKLRIISIERLNELTFTIDSDYVELHEELIDQLKKVKPTFVDQ